MTTAEEWEQELRGFLDRAEAEGRGLSSEEVDDSLDGFLALPPHEQERIALRWGLLPRPVCPDVLFPRLGDWEAWRTYWEDYRQRSRAPGWTQGL